MRTNQRFNRLLVLPALVVVAVLIALITSRRPEPAGEATRPDDSESQTVTQPAPPTPRPEPTAEAPAEVPSEAAVAEVEPEPTPTTAPAAPELEAYESVTEFFRVQVPEGWRTEETVPGAGLVMANSEAALERYNSGGAVEPGDFIVNVGFLPYRFLQTNELGAFDFQYDAAPDIFLRSLLPIFRMDDSYEYGEPALVSLSDGRDAGQLIVSAEEREGSILMFVAGDNVIALVSAVAFPGEMDQFQELANAVASGVSFGGEQDALYGALLGG